MERIAVPAPGRLEICGRWHGVRGRRFVRPTLIIKRASDGGEDRVLAELDHKPWAADDDQEWLAVFATDVTPAEVAGFELSVAPDITVPLTRPRRARAASRRARPGTDRTTEELERVRARAAAAAEAVERERERRQALEQALESERAESRRVRIELGQLQAELELARAAGADNQESGAELDRVQRELYAARQQLERANREREQAAQAHAETRTELHEQKGALESAREALERERAEAGRAHDYGPPTGSRPRSNGTSLYHRAAWGGRLLAVIVLAAVVIVIVLLIQGTVGK